MSLYKKTRDYAAIPPELHQIFKVFLGTKYLKTVLVENRLKQDITTSGIKVCEYLYTVTFATEEQLIEYCRKNGYFTGEPVKIKKGIDNLLKMKVINFFHLSDEEQTEPLLRQDNEALTIYCPTMATCMLLDNFSNIETFGWDPTQVHKTSGKVAKYLTTTRFYNYLSIAKKDMLVDFVARKQFIAKTDGNMMPFAVDFAFTLYDEENDCNKYFLADIFREYESIEDIQLKVRMREALLCTNSWKRYYPDIAEPPVYICCVQNSETLQFMAEQIEENGGIRLVPLYYLEEWFDKELNENVFLTYDSSQRIFNTTQLKEFQ